MIKVHCTKCDQYYEIQSSTKRSLNDLNIKYAKCPSCGHPRDGKNIIKPKMKNTCSICGRPPKNKDIKLCQTHYVAKWKRDNNFNEYMRIYRYVVKLLQVNKVIK